MVQIVLTIIVLLALAGVTYLLYRSRANERPSAEYFQRITIESLGELVSQELAELVRDDDLMITSDTHFQAMAIKNVR